MQDTIQHMIIDDVLWNTTTYDMVYPCFSWEFFAQPGFITGTEAVMITEIGFDWTDEWIEITNTTSTDIEHTLVLSWVKSKPLVLTWLFIPAYSSIVIADSASFMTWDMYIITWQWLSIPDTTWFTIDLVSSQWVLYDTVSFTQWVVLSIPNNYSLDTILLYTWDQPYTHWYISNWYTINLLSWYYGTPWVAFCGDITTWDGNTTSDLDLWGDNQQFTGTDSSEYSGESIDEPQQNTWTTNWVVTFTTGTTTTTGIANTVTGTTSTTTNNSWTSNNPDQQTTQDTPANHQLSHWDSCVLSEIHAVSDLLPEYIEIYCDRSMSWDITIIWLGTSTTIKKFHLQLTTGQHLIVTSSLSWFIYTWNILLLPWISLLDGGEQLAIQRPYKFYTWEIYTGYITYPTLQKWESYYPTCSMSWANCLPKNIPTPWYSQYYTDIYYPYLPTKTVYQTVSSSTTSSSTSSSSTYYQDLYKKRKEAAQIHEKTIAELKKSVKNSTIWTWNIAKIAPKSTTTSKTSSKSTSTSSSSSKTNQLKSTTSKSTNTTTKTTSKITPKATSKNTATTKSTSTSTKTATPKAKTVSTTSKAYILLTNEHKIYKAYADFIHKYLKSHLYTQYDSLQLSAVQSLLKKSLQTAKQNRTILSYSWWQEISIFDFSTQRQKTTSSNKNSLDIFAKNTYPLFSKFVQGKEKISNIPILTLYTQYFIWKKLLVDI